MSEQIVIVGPGRMGLALGAALHQAGEVERLIYHGRTLEPPPHPLFDPEGGAEYRLGPHPVPAGTTIVILAVPDQALAEVAHDLALVATAPPGCVALHLAGALSADVLTPLHSAGYAIGSLHPLQTVADRWSGGDRLFGAAFALAGEPAAIAAGRRLVSALGGRTLLIPPALRPVYHAAAVLASNSLVALAAAAARLLGQAGVAEDDAVPSILPLVRGTLDNLEHLGAPAALTGPIARGDLDTVRLHLARLSREDRALYCALGLETLRLARAVGLDEDKAAELESLLSSA
ncbi:MAG: DUF2520 domain-containing protein [Gemmatimonadetes bacterium]|nr:DUF2520 domain-containing protein [Gemmatimonadota bacterium]